MELIRSHKRGVFASFLLAVVLLPSQALAIAQDYSPVSDDIGTEITAAVPVALAAVGIVIGITVAYKLVRKMIRA